MIASFYSFEPLVAAAHAFSPTSIDLIVAEDSMSKIEDALAKVKEVYGTVATIQVIKVKGSDLLAIAKTTINLVESEEGRKIVNISGGWKLLAQGMLYGCYARPELVEKIVCNNLEEDNAIVELPKLCFGLSTAKKNLLKEIADRKGRSIAKIADKLGKTRGMIYQHLKELKDNGYVDEKFDITLAGRMALL